MRKVRLGKTIRRIHLAEEFGQDLNSKKSLHLVEKPKEKSLALSESQIIWTGFGVDFPHPVASPASPSL